MPQYRFITRLLKDQEAEAIEVDYRNDDEAIEQARLALRSALHIAAQEGYLLDEEIEVINDRGAVVAVVTADVGSRH